MEPTTTEPRTQPDDGGAGTGSHSEPATQPNANGGASDQGATPGQPDGETVTLKKEDYNNLVAQRDRANNRVKEDDEGYTELFGAVNGLLKDKVVADMQKTYPDVPKEILEGAESPEQMETLAKGFQQAVEKKQQENLQNLQQVTQPAMSDDERAAALKQAEKDGDFEKMVELKKPSGWR